MAKKIFLIAPSVSGGGGAEKTVSLLSNALVNRGFKVYLAVLSSKEATYKLDTKVEYYKIDRSLKSSNRVFKNIYRLKLLKSMINSFRPDLLVGYTIQGGIMGCILSRRTGVKCVVCERQDPYQFSYLMRKLRDKLYKNASGAVFQTIDAQSYFSNIVKDSVVIPNFININTIPDVTAIEDRKNVICSVGRLTEAKDHRTLIKAFALVHAKLPNFKLIIWGDGELRENLIEYAKQLNLDNFVVFPGRSSTVLDEIKNSKIFILSSRYEGYPNALLEAMALGIPCISTDCPCGGPKSMIIDGQNGFLIPVGDFKKMAERTLNVLSNEALMKLFINNGQKVRNTNSEDLIISKWIKYFDGIIVCSK